MIKSPNSFEEILSRTIDDTIRGILGEGAAEIYYHMKDYGIRSDRLGEKPEVLEKAMVEIFKIGWEVFRKAILRSLCQQLNLSTGKFANHDFVQCIEIVKGEFLKNTSSMDQNQVIKNIKNNKLTVNNDDSILKLSLPETGPRIGHKTCKVCDKTVDSRSKKGLLAELCGECWELQNDVWEVIEVAHIPKGSGYNRGDRLI